MSYRYTHTVIMCCIGYHFMSDLRVLMPMLQANGSYRKPTMNAAVYKEFLDSLFLEVEDSGMDFWIFGHDGAKAHTANVIQQYLRDRCPDFVSKDQWPAKSPDLAPPDYGVFNYITDKIRTHHPAGFSTDEEMAHWVQVYYNEIR